jgi:transcriptional regulator with XRE-family HTH domain
MFHNYRKQTMTVNVNQIRAARGLLGWSQKELACRAGISDVSIINYENGKRTPHKGTYDKIMQAFDIAGVGFTRRGVEIKDDLATTLSGPEWLARIISDMRFNLSGAQKAQAFVTLREDGESGRAIAAALERLGNEGIDLKILATHRAAALLSPAIAARIIGTESPSGGSPTCLLYGDKLAICSPQENKAVIYRDPALAASERAMFGYLFDAAAPAAETATAA